MVDVLRLLAHLLLGLFKSPAQLQAENTALRHQLNVLRRGAPRRPRLNAGDRVLFVWLLRTFPSIREAIQIIQPETILRWHRRGFRSYWRWKSRARVDAPGSRLNSANSSGR